jgi:predicted dehydrogenase
VAKLRAIVVGAGGISKAWFKPLKAERIEVAAVVDLVKEKAEKAIQEWELAGTIASANLKKALRDVRADFLVDLTTPEAHCKVACAALQAGLHVIGEKPMAASMAEARRMVKASEQAGKLYMVSQSRRWNGLHEALARTVGRGDIGALTTVNCDFYVGAHFGGFRAEMKSPLILDMSIHHFDLARMVSGKDPVRVWCEEFNPAGSWYQGDVAANAVFEMTDGVRFAYRGSWCAEGCPTSWNGNWRVVGTRGTVLYENDQEPRGEGVAKDEGFIRPYQPVKVAKAPMRHGGMHGALREFLDFIRRGRMPQCECHDNIRSLAMVFAAMESSRKMRPVEVKAL